MMPNNIDAWKYSIISERDINHNLKFEASDQFFWYEVIDISIYLSLSHRHENNL